MKEPRIVCAAIRVDNEIICGARHFDQVMYTKIDRKDEEHRLKWRKAEQGFIDQFGNFLTREEAYIIAERNNQIINFIGYKGNKLFSEHLY